MKQSLVNFLQKPKTAIPAALIVALIIGVAAFQLIGRPPKVNLTDAIIATSTPAESVGNTVDLAFLKTGRLAAVSTSVGATVKKGEVLASLEAGEALGAVNQAKGALDLATAQLASLNVQYATAKQQQDVLVANAYRTLLSSGLAAVPKKLDSDSSDVVVDNDQIPQISGTYVCGREGFYKIHVYPSEAQSGYSFELSGVEKWGSGSVTYYTPQPLGACGLFIQFPVGYHSEAINWLVEIPNSKSSNYATNKNAYDLAVTTRDQVLKQLEASLGKNDSVGAGVAQAAVRAATGNYEAALGLYRNNLIVAPTDGVVTFTDARLKIGQTINAGKTVITIAKK